MVDCWMSLNVQYALELANTCIKEGVDIHWWEEVLHPDDFDGHALVSPLEAAASACLERPADGCNPKPY